MATFTMRLHTILGVDSPDDADASLIGLDRYPIWDEGYRSELNHKIIMRFWNREIGHETVPMFVHAVRRKMGEIMPYYSQLAETATWEFDPFETINVEHTSDSETEGTGNTTGVTDATGTVEGESTSNESSSSQQDSGSESVSRTVSSEHPQTRLNNYEDYATASQDGESKSANESQATSQGEGSQSDSQNSQQHQTSAQDSSQQQHQTGKQTSQGTQGNKSELLEQYRATLIGVDTMILDELEVLFMGVWDTDHSYTTMGSYPFYLF